MEKFIVQAEMDIINREVLNAFATPTILTFVMKLVIMMR